MRARKFFSRKALFWIFGLVLGLPLTLMVLTLAVLLVAINSGPGQRLIERKAGPLSGGMVEISGLSGALPWHLGLNGLRLHDREGVWLELDGLDLHWSPSALLRRDIVLSTLSARRLAVVRAPVSDSSKPKPQTESRTSGPNLRVDLAHLHLSRIEVGASLVGQAGTGNLAVFSLDGHAHIASIAPFMKGVSAQTLPVMDVGLHLTRMDVASALDLDLVTPRDRIALSASYREPKDGFATTLVHLSQLDPLSIHLKLNGPRKSAGLDFGLNAGPTNANGAGTVDLIDRSDNIHLEASAPAMTLMPGVGWNSIALDATLHGPIQAPAGQGLLDIDGLSAGGAGIGHLHTRFDGTEARGEVDDALAHLAVTLTGLRIPGPRPTLLAGAPVVLDLTAHPLARTLPLVARIDHPLLHLATSASLKPAMKGHLDLTLPDLQPLAGAAGVVVQGSAGVSADIALPPTPQSDLALAANGSLAIRGGQAQAVHLIGPNGHFSLQLSKSPADVLTLQNFALDGRALHVFLQSVVDLANRNAMRTHANIALPDLRQLAPALQGTMTLDATAEGPEDDLAFKAHLGGDFGTKQVARGPLALDADFSHLPGRPQGTLHAGGTLDHAPLVLDTALMRDENGTVHLDLHQLDWNSMHGQGRLRLPSGSKVPLGDLDLAVRDLRNFSRLAGQAIAGHLMLGLHSTESGNAPPVVRLGLDGSLVSSAVTIRTLKLGGTVDNPLRDPDLGLIVDLAGLQARGVTGHARVTAKGTQSALVLTVKGAFQNVAGAPANADLAALLDVPKKSVRVDRLSALVKGEQVRLGRPANVLFGDRMGVDRLLLTLAPVGTAPATIDIAGTLSPQLSLNARLDHLTPAIARPFAPDLAAKGVISAAASLKGTMRAPTGTVSLKAQGLGMQTGPAASLPSADILASIGLAGTMARVDATLNAGPSVALAVHGTVPLNQTGTLTLATMGHVDLGIANSILGANGMGLAGKIAVDMGVSGTMAQPRATGQITLRNAGFDHYAQGIHLSDMSGVLLASGDTVTFDHVLAHAGPGTIGVDGNIGIFRPGLPVALHIVSQKARPIVSDLLTATINTNLHIHGQATTRLDVDGRVDIPGATINIPDSMPASVPQLDVIRPGQKVTSGGSGLMIGLGVDVVSPGELFVRGHGIFAEMRGRLHVGGLSAAPIITGGFDLRRGSFNLAGINLNFTHGRVAFNGSGVNHKLDPTLDFRADRNARSTLASLLVTGYASAPKIDFTSAPSLPRDQVLAILLFGTDSHSLSATQLAELGAAVAELAGGSAFDPLGKVRNALGLDHLGMGGGSGVGNGGASLEAGKYVMRGVYVGARQATSGSGTQAQVQIDLTRRLKLNTTVGTGGQVTGFTTPENDPGSSVGLSYGFDY